MFPEQQIIDSTRDEINAYMKNELNQDSKVYVPWVVLTLQQELNMARESGFVISVSDIVNKVVNLAKVRIRRLYSDAQIYKSDLPGILNGRANEPGEFQADETTWGTPIPRGVSSGPHKRQRDEEMYRVPPEFME
jgi:hypothetical protein